MHWLLIALIAPFLWSVLNYTDKYLIVKYARESGVAGLAIFASAFSLIVSATLYLFSPNVLGVSRLQAGSMIATGFLIAIAILLYLYALEKDHASHVVPFWFTVPLFAYIFGVLFLGEYLTPLKIIGSLITILGALVLSLELEEKVTFKKKVVLLMLGSSIFIALSDVLFKNQVAEVSFVASIFWNQIGFALFGALGFLLVKRYRHEFIALCRDKSKDLFLINASTELITITATAVGYYALTLAPVALILVLAYTFQPFFVFMEGVLLTRFLPHIHREHLSKKHVAQKITAIIVMAIGTYLVLR
jgi:drug/metabolite transporter (DMT)-like permease